jgi:hypothetical protein
VRSGPILSVRQNVLRHSILPSTRSEATQYAPLFSWDRTPTIQDFLQTTLKFKSRVGDQRHCTARIECISEHQRHCTAKTDGRSVGLKCIQFALTEALTRYLSGLKKPGSSDDSDPIPSFPGRDFLGTRSDFPCDYPRRQNLSAISICTV